MMMIDLTIIILTKNEEQNLRKSIESFRGVTRRIVDGADSGRYVGLLEE